MKKHITVRVRDWVLANWPGSMEQQFVLRWINPRADRNEKRAAGIAVKPLFGTHKAKGALGKADDAFSEYIRTVATVVGSDGNRYGPCCTCGKVKPMRGGLQCGHWHERGNFGTRFMIMNAHPQCVWCNSKTGGDGMKPQHAAYIREKHGPGAPDFIIQWAELHQQRQREPELRAIANEFRNRTTMFLATGKIFKQGEVIPEDPSRLHNVQM